MQKGLPSGYSGETRLVLCVPSSSSAGKRPNYYYSCDLLFALNAWCVVCRNKVDFCEDIKEQYKEMRDEFMAGLEDRKYLTIDQVQAKGLQVHPSEVPYSLLQ